MASRNLRSSDGSFIDSENEEATVPRSTLSSSRGGNSRRSQQEANSVEHFLPSHSANDDESIVLAQSMSLLSVGNKKQNTDRLSTPHLHQSCTNDGEGSRDKPTADSDESLDEDTRCPVCFLQMLHPVRLPCNHVFCYLCIKGVAMTSSRRCALCRQPIPSEFLLKPTLVHAADVDLSRSSYRRAQCSRSRGPDGGNLCETVADDTFDQEFEWYYEGRNGWWKYDTRTSQEIEGAFMKNEEECQVMVAGLVFIVDLVRMVQYRVTDPTKRRKIKRDVSSAPIKGIAGISLKRLDGKDDDHDCDSATSDAVDRRSDLGPSAMGGSNTADARLFLGNTNTLLDDTPHGSSAPSSSSSNRTDFVNQSTDNNLRRNIDSIHLNRLHTGNNNDHPLNLRHVALRDMQGTSPHIVSTSALHTPGDSVVSNAIAYELPTQRYSLACNNRIGSDVFQDPSVTFLNTYSSRTKNIRGFENPVYIGDSSSDLVQAATVSFSNNALQEKGSSGRLVHPSYLRSYSDDVTLRHSCSDHHCCRHMRCSATLNRRCCCCSSTSSSSSTTVVVPPATSASCCGHLPCHQDNCCSQTSSTCCSSQGLHCCTTNAAVTGSSTSSPRTNITRVYCCGEEVSDNNNEGARQSCEGSNSVGAHCLHAAAEPHCREDHREKLEFYQIDSLSDSSGDIDDCENI